MALLTFKTDNKLVGVVRNHKCGTTTVMSYIAQALWNADPDQMQNYKSYTEALGKEQYLGLREPIGTYYKRLLECDIRIATWRDPVDKFVSGFYHILKYRMVPTKNLTEFLDNFDNYYTNINVWDHCSTNTARLGSDRSVYTHVVNYKDVDRVIKPLIESLSGKNIKTVAYRVQDTKPEPTEKEVERIKVLMKEDYENGWC